MGVLPMQEVAVAVERASLCGCDRQGALQPLSIQPGVTPELGGGHCLPVLLRVGLPGLKKMAAL